MRSVHLSSVTSALTKRNLNILKKSTFFYRILNFITSRGGHRVLGPAVILNFKKIKKKHTEVLVEKSVCNLFD